MAKQSTQYMATARELGCFGGRAYSHPLTPGLANAAPPVREPSPLPTNQPFPLQDTLGDDPCGFPVLLELTTNKEVITTFTRQSGVTLHSHHGRSEG